MREDIVATPDPQGNTYIHTVSNVLGTWSSLGVIALYSVAIPACVTLTLAMLPSFAKLYVELAGGLAVTDRDVFAVSGH